MTSPIDKLIESRIELGNLYASQNKSIMTINEEFQSSILNELANHLYNKTAFHQITSKLDVVWTDITNSMITVYNTSADYMHVKDAIAGAKPLIKNTQRFGIYIFTSNSNQAPEKVEYVLAGKTAADDTVYVSKEMSDLLESRYDLVDNHKKLIYGRFGIDPRRMPRGTVSDASVGEAANAYLPEILLKALYDCLCDASLGRQRVDGKKINMQTDIDRNSVFDLNTFTTYEDAYNVINRAIKDSMSNDKNLRNSIRFLGHSTDWDNFRKVYRAHPDNFDIFEYTNKDLVRTYLSLAVVRPNLNRDSEKELPENLVLNASPTELQTQYDIIAGVNLRNSLLYNLSADTSGSLPKSRNVTQFMQLTLVPDFLSHLYIIHQDYKEDGELSDINDIEDIESDTDDAASAQERNWRHIEQFGSDDAVTARRRNFDVGIRERPATRFSSYYIPSEKNSENVGGTQGKRRAAIRAYRRALQRGMTGTKREINSNLGRLARDAENAERFKQIDPEYFKRQRKIEDTRTAGTVVNSTVDNVDADVRGQKAKYSYTVPVKLRRVVKTFQDTYESIENNSVAQYQDLLNAYKDYYMNRAANSAARKDVNAIFSLKHIQNFYVYMTAFADYVNDIIGYNTFGEIPEAEFVNMIGKLYDDYNDYINIIMDLTDAYADDDDDAIVAALTSLNNIAKQYKNLFKKYCTDNETADYLAAAEARYDSLSILGKELKK